MIVDLAVYLAGERIPGELSLEDAYRRSRSDDAFVWIGLFEPTEEEFESVRHEFDLHELAVEDAIKAHQRPKLERYEDTFLLVLKPARYDDPSESIQLGEILIFVGEGFVVAVRHGSATPLAAVRQRLEQRPDLLVHGPGAVVHGILDHIVDGYFPVVAGLEQDVEEVEAEVFSGPRSNPVERIYFLRREVLEFHQATHPLGLMLERMAGRQVPFVNETTDEYYRDVHDHLMRVNQHVEGLRDRLTSVLQASLTQIGIQQNADMRKISAWVAIAAGPTVLGSIYGMNFAHIPAAEFRYGFLGAVALMMLMSAGLFVLFRHRGWL